MTGHRDADRLLAFVVLLLMGMPVAFAIGISGTLFFVQHPELPVTIPIQLTVTQTQNFALLAVPLFILAGNFMNKSGITRTAARARRRAHRPDAGRARPGVDCAGGADGRRAGSSIADAAMKARMLGREMLGRGFSRGYAAGVLSFGSLLTPIIPPGIGFILYGTVGQVSIGRLFAAGHRPGPAAVGGAGGRDLGHGAAPRLQARAHEPPTLREVARAHGGGIWAILFPVILLVGLRFGIFTPSEIGAFAVVYAVADRRVRLPQADSARHSRGPREQPDGRRRGDVPARAVGGLRLRHRVRAHSRGHLVRHAGADRQPDAVMVLIVLFVLVGRLLHRRRRADHHADADLPAVRPQLGVDPVHFGLVFILAATIGNFTPPVGSAMYAVCSILRCPIGEYTRESLPLLVAVSGCRCCWSSCPRSVLFVPNWLFGPP